MKLNQQKQVDEDIYQQEYVENQKLAQKSSQNTIKTYKSFRDVLLRVINLCLSSFYFGYCLGYFGSFQFTTIASIFTIQANFQFNQGFLQGCIPIGGGIGALTSSILLKRLSRRNSLLFINFWALVAGLIILVPNIGLLYLGRIIQGLCVGMYCAIIPLFIKQISPLEISGTLGALNQTLIATGVFMAYFLQTILSLFSEQQDHWRLCFGLTLITLIVQSIVLIFIYNEETPKYYLLNSCEEECKKLLKKIYQEQYVQQILKQKKKDLNLLFEQTTTPQQNFLNEESNGKDIQLRNKYSENSKESCKESTSSNLGKNLRTKIAIHLAILQQMVGINSVIAYGASIAQQVVPSLKTVIPSLLNIQQIVATILSSYFLSKFGRKPILQSGTFLSLVALIFIALGFILQDHIKDLGNALIIIGLIIFMGNFGFSLGPVVWLYIAEIVQPQVIPFSTLSNWSAAAVIIITFPILKDAFGSAVPLFGFYAIWTFVSLFINKRYVIETKGKTEKQIFKQYSDLND